MKILNLPLARSRVDRAEHLRKDPIALEALWERARVIHFDGEKFLIDPATSALRFLKSFEAPDNGDEFFLGLDGNQPYFLFMSPQISGEAEITRRSVRLVAHLMIFRSDWLFTRKV